MLTHEGHLRQISSQKFFEEKFKVVLTSAHKHDKKQGADEHTRDDNSIVSNSRDLWRVAPGLLTDQCITVETTDRFGEGTQGESLFLFAGPVEVFVQRTAWRPHRGRLRSADFLARPAPICLMSDTGKLVLGTVAARKSDVRFTNTSPPTCEGW